MAHGQNTVAIARIRAHLHNMILQSSSYEKSDTASLPAVQRVPTVAQVQLQLLCTSPPALVITAVGNGIPGSTGAQLVPYICFRQSANGVYEFEMVATPPATHTNAAETALATEYIWLNAPADVTAITVHAQSNSITAFLQPPNGTTKNQKQPATTCGISFRHLRTGAPLTAAAHTTTQGNITQLHVYGLLQTNSNDDVVMIKSARPHATQSTILELHLTVIDTNGRIKNVYKPFMYEGPLAHRCTAVHIHVPGLPPLQVDVHDKVTVFKEV